MNNVKPQYVLILGCWQPKRMMTRDQVLPMFFDTEAEAIVEFNKVKEAWHQLGYEPWECSLIDPKGNKTLLN